MTTTTTGIRSEAARVARPETAAPAGFRVYVLAHVGMSNLGDELLVTATLDAVRQCVPGVRIAALTMDPADTMRRHGIAAHPLRPGASTERQPKRRYVKPIRVALGLIRLVKRYMRELRFAIRSAPLLKHGDVLIIPGSSQFIEAYGGAWGFPLTLFRWTLLARLRGARVAFLSMGAEDVASRSSRALIRWTVGLAHYCSVRDEVSVRRLREMGVKAPVPVVPDLVLSHAPAPLRRDRRPGRRTLAMNIVPYFAPAYWRASDPQRWESVLAAATTVAQHALEQGHRVEFYGTTDWADRIASTEIIERLHGRLGSAVADRIAQADVHTFAELWAVLARADWVIASRYHGVVTALLARKPLLGLCYEQKTADLMASMGLARYAIAMDDMSGEQLITMLGSLQAQDRAVVEHINGEVAAAAAAVGRQFDHVMHSLSVRTAGASAQ